MIASLFLGAIWFILPAYVANAVPPLEGSIKWIRRYNAPLDFGKSWKGKPILGPGKTWMGLFLGLFFGSLVGFLQGFFPFEPQGFWMLGFILSLGALLGDMGASFFKRRLGIKPGGKVILLDQLDFVVGAFLLAGLGGWFNWRYFVILLVVTPPIHLVTNVLGHKLNLKSRPW